ncbi:hypothetical protein Cni_G09460 [Canna indica]|uniref:Phytocyanin domain-containing protein n=1 Tax=Canna indica TaxID=4628 RepID=A0AAQ3K2M5_9LILI|nr:hypothetical protein Cni_G09460 [Canna indica]
MRTAANVLVGALLIALMSSPCCAYDHYVGGRDGWVLHPRLSYSRWANINRFQVHDNLIFKYEKGNDSVLVVTEPSYSSCNVRNPIASYKDGSTTYRFNHSGPFFFISGAAGHCTQGQKLNVVVMAIRQPPPAPSPHSGGPPGSTSPPPSSSSTSLAASKFSLGVTALLMLGRALLQ